MLPEPQSPMRKACERRFPSWTLYARAFSGNRADAEDIVRGAVSRVVRGGGVPASEADAHGRVLREIRSSSLELIEQREGRPLQSQGGVLRLLLQRRDDPGLRDGVTAAFRELRQLPGDQRKTIELALLRRPALPLHRVAKRLGVEVEAVQRYVENGLDRLAAVVHEARPGPLPDRHPEVKDLAAYVEGALSGDEARAISVHSGGCAECGDRLGIMMLLRARTAETARKPLVPRRVWLAGLTLLALISVVALALGARSLMPNPWDEHASRETVPRWFHDFFYGPGRGVEGGDQTIAEALDLLVRGEYRQVIDLLEPLEDPARNPEAAAYLGIARYLDGDESRRTVQLLDVGKASTRAGRLAGWYLANVHLARGDIDEARRQLQALAWVADWVGRRAAALLERLDQAELELEVPVTVG